MPVVKFKSKKRIDNLDSLCCWCYEISATEGEEAFKEGESYGLDFSKDIPIQHPENYKECNGYSRLWKGGPGPQHQATHWVVSARSIEKDTRRFDICFIAPCAENVETRVSLDKWVPSTPGPGYEWRTIGGGIMVGPAAIAAGLPKADETLTLLARYEGLKLSSLLSRTPPFPVTRGEALIAPTEEPPTAEAGHFEVYKDKAGEWRWRLRTPSGEIIADSGEGYKRRVGCLGEIELVKRNAPKAVIVEVEIHGKK